MLKLAYILVAAEVLVKGLRPFGLIWRASGLHDEVFFDC